MMKYLITILILQLQTLYCHCYAQNNIVVPDSIVYNCHKENLDSIAFFKTLIPIETFSKADWIDTFYLKENTDLQMRVFMRNSLTNYIYRLAPDLSAEALTSNGNYYFSFYIDNQLIYTEQLPIGAGSAESKNTRTVFRVPLISTSNEDSWGRFLWQRFMMQGGADALVPGNHKLRIEIRPYLQLDTLLIGEMIASGSILLIVPEPHVPDKLKKIQLIKPTTAFKINTTSIDTNLIETLNEKIYTNRYKNITSIVIIKNNNLLMESYYNGAKRKTLHDTRSVSKSIAGALTGIAINNGYIQNEFTTLNNYYDLNAYQNFSPQKDTISLHSLLSMQSILNGSDTDAQSPGNEEHMYPSKNWVQFALDLPIDTQKLKNPHWDYFTAGVVVVGDIINKSVQGGLVQFADETLFAPLGIKKYKWEYTPQKVGNTAGGLRLSSLDLAKIGELYRQNGKWNNTQIIPASWVEKSLSHQAILPDGNYYGYLFWNKIYVVNNQSYEVYYASGNGGNKIFIFKDYPIVIVITATAYNEGYAHIQIDNMMENYLIPALKLE